MKQKIVKRGCGDPRPGKIYLTMEFSNGGTPFRYFITDPVAPLPLGVSIKDRGMSMVDIGRTTYVVDHVGSSSYPNATDFIEEVGRFGLHQLIERSFNFNKITPDMWILFTHSEALVDDPKMLEMYYERDGRFHDPLGEWLNMPCPNKSPLVYEQHMERGWEAAEQGKWCAGLNWSALQTYNESEEDRDDQRELVTRNMPAFEYKGRKVLKNTVLKPGIILALPFSALGFRVYTNDDTHEHENALEALDSLPAELKERVDVKTLNSGKE